MQLQVRWKDVLSQIETLSDAELEAFSNQNLWLPESEDHSKLDKILFDIENYCKGPNFLRALVLLLPCFDPIKVVENYFDIFKTILIDSNSQELKTIEYTSRICISALTSHQMDSTPEYHMKLKTCANRFLNCFITETQERWEQLGNAIVGTDEYTRKISLDPSGIPRLEYVVFSFGMEKPLLFYELLNEMAININSRLQAFSLLKSFLILEGAPTYYLIDSDLYKTVILSAIVDTDLSLFLTSITILTILLPIIATKSLPHLKELIFILLKAIDWEISFPFIISNFSHNNSGEGEKLNEVLAMHSVFSVHRCVNQYFTVLYGMFPSNITIPLSNFLKGMENCISIQSELHKAPDSFEEIRNKYMKSIMLIPARKEKVEAILSAHKCNINSILSNPDQERENPWFMNKESSEIMIECFNLETHEIHDISSPAVTIGHIDNSSLDDIASHILHINRFLYGSNFLDYSSKKLNNDNAHNVPKDPMVLLKIFYIILMNESFFKECMRQYQILHIRQLKKVHFKNQLAQVSSKNKELEFENVQKELKSALQLNTQLQSDIKKLESRLKILDLSHAQRFSSITNQLREKTHANLQLQTDLESRIEAMKKLETSLLNYQTKVIDLETKMGFFEAEISKNQLLAGEITELKMKLASTPISNPEEEVKHSKDMEQKLVQLEFLNTNLESRIKEYENELARLERNMPKDSEKLLLESRLKMAVSFLKSVLIEQIQTKAYEELNDLFRIKMEEAEINRKIMKKQILDLEKACLTSLSQSG